MSAYFAAAMKCPVCGTVSAADSSTGMANRLADDEEILRVGDDPAISTGAMQATLLTTAEPIGDKIRLLQSWHCATCGSRNWAEIVFDHGRIESIDNTPLTKPVVARSNFIHDDLGFVFEDLTGESLYVDNRVRPDFVELLRAHLPDAG